MTAAVQEDTVLNHEKRQWVENLLAQKKLEKLDRGILAETLDKISVYEDNAGIRADIRFRFALDDEIILNEQ